MRFFRVPTFSGIEVHREDADRGTLRSAENCVVHNGGVRSGPIWKKVDAVPLISEGRANYVSAIDDGDGNSMIFVSRYGEVHDIALQTETQNPFGEADRVYGVLNDSNLCDNFELDFENFSSYGDTLQEAVVAFNASEESKIKPENDNYFVEGFAYFSDIGNKLLAISDGSKNPILLGKGPTSGTEDISFYKTQNTGFPKCQYMVRGPKKILVGAGDPDNPLTIYVSEPAGESDSIKTGIQSLQLSKIDILASNASKITGLSTRSDVVVVHTDKGCHLLYAPSADQADSGFRLEQKNATNFSGAADHQAVAGEQGTQTYWLGADRQIYKDESSTAGPDGIKEKADPDQASWKSKGSWEKEIPSNVCKAFSTFEPQTGMYIVFTESL